MNTFLIKYRWQIIVFGIALILRAALFALNLSHNDHQLIPTIKADDGWYELSQSALTMHGFLGDTVPPYHPNPLRPPLWPYLIAAIVWAFKSYWVVVALELVMGALIPVLGMHLVSRVFAESHAAKHQHLSRWVGGAMALSPYPILLSSLLYSETCFTFFFLLGLIFLFRFLANRTWRSLIWAATLLGLATLVKPTIQYVPILVPLFMLWYFRKELTAKVWKQVAAFILLFLAVITPWLVRNRVEFGVWGMSAQPTFNLQVYLVPTVLAIEHGTNFRIEYDKFVLRPGFNPDNVTLATSPEYSREALGIIAQHKVALVKSVGGTIVTFFTHDGMLTLLQYSGIVIPNTLSKPVLWMVLHDWGALAAAVGHYATTWALPILLMRLVWIGVTILFLFGLLRSICVRGLSEKHRLILILAALIVAYFALTTSINGLGVNARFRVPIEVFIFAFAFYGLFDAKRTILSKL